MNTFRTVLGTNKKQPRSRIWIEGKRLVEAGFTVGKKYFRQSGEGRLVLFLEHSTLPGSHVVSGKGEKPIIDITGQYVRDLFTGTHVNVTFKPGCISITNESVSRH